MRVRRRGPWCSSGGCLRWRYRSHRWLANATVVKLQSGASSRRRRRWGRELGHVRRAFVSGCRSDSRALGRPIVLAFRLLLLLLLRLLLLLLSYTRLHEVCMQYQSKPSLAGSTGCSTIRLSRSRQLKLNARAACQLIKGTWTPCHDDARGSTPVDTREKEDIMSRRSYLVTEPRPPSVPRSDGGATRCVREQLAGRGRCSVTGGEEDKKEGESIRVAPCRTRVTPPIPPRVCCVCRYVAHLRKSHSTQSRFRVWEWKYHDIC